MNIFDQFVIPGTSNHILLIKYMLIISLMLFIPYAGMLLGGMFISSYFDKKGKREGNSLYTRFAKDVINKLTISESAKFGLGIVPALSIFFAYVQLLYSSNTVSLSMMALAVVIFFISLSFVYKYRETYKLERMLSQINYTGSIGKYLLLISLYILAGTMALSASPDNWGKINNVMQLIFSWQSFFGFLTLLCISGLISGSAIIFFFFKWDGGLKDMPNDYSELVRKFAGNLTLISGTLFPLMILLSYLYLPYSTLSPLLFYYTIAVFAISLILGSFILSILKSNNTDAATSVFMLIIVLITLNIFKDQQAFATAVLPNTVKLTQLADNLEKESQNKLMQNTGINAESIYTQKCSACHKFDQKLVGPPYDQVVPKYNGDVQKLAEFILNPQKIDPAYPPMPVQGLKKKEATAMAQWLINKSEKK